MEGHEKINQEERQNKNRKTKNPSPKKAIKATKC